jgi:hypothetical protein
VIPTEGRVAFLRRIHLFHDISDVDLASIAAKLKEEVVEQGKAVFTQGGEADRFYIIYQGKVAITQKRAREERVLASMVGGDYFGEEALFTNRRRSATISAAEKSSLFSLSRLDFNEIIKRYPRLKMAFEVSIASRRLARQTHFSWLWPDEVVYFVARKHEILLARGLSGPVFALVVPAALLFGFFMTRSLVAISSAAVSLVAIMGWAVWNAIDWGNDYYIVTNQRVIWLEKVIGLYDSRQEAPLTTILSVGVETDMTGRLLDYGNVVVRTFVGRLPFSHVSHPHQAAHMIEEQWGRTKHFASRAERDAMHNVLRQKLGLTVENKAVEPTFADRKVAVPSPLRPALWRVLIANWFKLRTEDSGTITYRKHWYVLGHQVWQPSLLILLVLGSMAARLYTLWRTPGVKLFDFSTGIRVDTPMAALPVILVPLVVWWVYQYIDWSNDIFQVTPDQIVDVDRKPFGTEERRAAPLENILSMEYKRLGVAGYLFNFGTVEISVGGTKLAFEDVLDPASVQADIDRRRATRIAKKREAEANAERERMADWLVAYHENASEFDQQSSPPEASPKSE